MESFLSDNLDMIWIVLALAVTGCLAGVMAGLLGVGGGVVIVPVLFFLFQNYGVSADLSMFVAVGTSLATIIATSISSVASHHRKGAVDWGILKRWSPFMIVGVIVGTWVAAQLSGHVLVGIFAVVAFVVAWRMLLSSPAPHLAERLPGHPLEGIYAFIIGALSVMIGIGGGSMTVPVLNGYNVPIRKAVACSSGLGLAIALPGMIGFAYAGYGLSGLPPYSIGYVNLLAFLLIVPLTVLFAPLGARLAHRLDPGKLKKGFAVFLLLTSLKMMAEAFGLI